MKLLSCSLLFFCIIGLSMCEFKTSELLDWTLKNYKIDGNTPEVLLNDVHTRFDSYCSGGSKNFRQHLFDVVDCFINIDRGNETRCAFFDKSVETCLSPTIKYFEECLKGDGKTLPRFLLDQSKAVHHYFCSIPTEQLFELGNFCYLHGTKYSDEFIVKIIQFIRKYKDQDVLPSKIDACKELDELRSVFVPHIEHSCFNLITKKSFIGFYDALKTPCH